MLGKKREDIAQSKSRFKTILQWLNTKNVSRFWAFIFYLIGIIILFIFALWNPWMLLGLIIIPFISWSFNYQESLSIDTKFEVHEKELSKQGDVITPLINIIVKVNLLMDIYELQLLKYLRLKYRKNSLIVIRVIIYFLLILVFILTILHPNLTVYSIYWPFRSLIIFILTVLFAIYIRVDRIKRMCRPFKTWAELVKQQLTFVSYNYKLKDKIKTLKEDLESLRQRIERFNSHFRSAEHVYKIFEDISYLLAVLTIFIPPLFNISMLDEILPYFISFITLFISFIIPYFISIIIDSKRFRKSEEVIKINSLLDLTLKRLYDVYV